MLRDARFKDAPARRDDFAVMNEFLNALPWRLASIAALAVGIVTLATGAADAWTGIERVGIAFFVFFVIGSFAKSLLAVGAASPYGHHTKSGASHRAHSTSAFRQQSIAPDVPEKGDATLGGVDGTTSL